MSYNATVCNHQCLAVTSKNKVFHDNKIDDRYNDSSQNYVWNCFMWKKKCIQHKAWDEITYPFPNFNGITVEV